MMLYLIKLNKDFDFVGWVIKTACLLHFRSVKFPYVKETCMMLVAFWRWWKLLYSTKDMSRQRNKSFSRFIDNWKHRLGLESMQMSYSYTSELPFKHFCKLTKQAETIRNSTKLRIVLETHKLSRYQSKDSEVSYISLTLPYKSNTKVNAYN